MSTGFPIFGAVRVVRLTDEGAASLEECFELHGKSHGADFANLYGLLERLANHRQLDAKVFSNLGDGFYQVKNRFGFRAAGWYANDAFVVGQVYLKKENKTQKADPSLLKRLQRARAAEK
jgi:hypothetical protein